jgi:hypothetical protein
MRTSENAVSEKVPSVFPLRGRASGARRYATRQRHYLLPSVIMPCLGGERRYSLGK